MKFGIQGYFDDPLHAADFRNASCTRFWFPWQRYFSPFWAKRATKDNFGAIFFQESVGLETGFYASGNEHMTAKPPGQSHCGNTI